MEKTYFSIAASLTDRSASDPIDFSPHADGLLSSFASLESLPAFIHKQSFTPYIIGTSSDRELRFGTGLEGNN